MDVAKLYDKLADEYDQWFDKYPLIFEAEVEAMSRVMRPFKRALEVGVGTGRFAEKLGIKEGIEPSVKMAAYARKRGIKVIEGVAEELPFADQTFDAVFMITLDCYLADMKPALLEAYRVLETGGFLAIGHVDIDAPPGYVYEENKENDDFYRDATFRGTKKVLEILEETGFEVLDICQTIETLENIKQEVKDGFGEGVFVALRAGKRK